MVSVCHVSRDFALPLSGLAVVWARRCDGSIMPQSYVMVGWWTS